MLLLLQTWLLSYLWFCGNPNAYVIIADVAFSDGKVGDYLFMGNFVYTVSNLSRLVTQNAVLFSTVLGQFCVYCE